MIDVTDTAEPTPEPDEADPTDHPLVRLTKDVFGAEVVRVHPRRKQPPPPG